MPRFYFHLHNDMYVEDEEGAELPDMAAAREYALESARDLASVFVKHGHINLNHFVRVTDEGGQDVIRIAFRDSFTIEG